MNTLDALKQYSTIVADSGDLDTISEFKPQDATTNPSLIYKAAQLPQYQPVIRAAIDAARHASGAVHISEAADHLAVRIGAMIVHNIPGKISTEVDARLSYDCEQSIIKARRLIELYQQVGVDKSRVLIKLAATWQGIKAAEALQQQGINCNLTLLFSFAQARACADAGVYLISPFVGRIYDWYKASQPQTEFTADNDPGVVSVKKIWQFYKMHGYNTVVMGASFRSTEQVMALAGCDRLTVAPALLEKLNASDAALVRQLDYRGEPQAKPAPLSEAEFLWLHHQDAMAVDKLAEGIRLFAVDQNKLEALLAEYQ
ncbi:transaldolase [Pantoea sp. B65]|uniref:transaldolase n=1 Tax=Pantoea sp. B65 TaxID=2813359 RepID=UPI0039B5A928